MLHLRVIAPEDLRDDVIGVLQREVGVANVLLYPGAALDPPGDEIAADIARECANDVIKHLKATVGAWDVAAKSVLRLAVNLVGIVIAGVLVLVLRPRGTLVPRVAQT